MIELSCFNWVQLIKKAGLPSGANHIALYLSTFMNAEQNIAWPSQSRIAHETGLSKQTVIKWVLYLESNEWLVVSKNSHQINTGRQSYLHNEYLINVPSKQVDELTDALSRGQTVIKQGSNCQVSGVKPVDTNNKGSNQLSNNEEFSTFWDKYPKKKNKGKAEVAWKKIKAKDFLDILKALDKAVMSKDWAKEEGKYIPYPSTWLNAKGWQDEDNVSSDDYGRGCI